MLAKPELKGNKRPGREPVRILLLEDDPQFAELLRAQLRRMPWVDSRLEVVATLAEALARLAGERIELVVTDLNLPDSSGLATVEALSRAGEQPVIVLTGDQNPALRAAAMECGAYDFLSKDQLSAAALERLVRLASMQANIFRSLRESEARFRSLLDLSADFYWESDLQHRVIQIEHGQQRHPVVNPGQLGKARWELPSTRPDAAGWAAHRATMEAHLPFHDFEIARLDEDGVERHRSISGEPVFDAAGAFKGYRGVGKDITARKRAEEDLRRFRMALDESADMVVLIDRASMRFVDVNSTACRLLGYSREEMLAMGPQDVLPASREELERSYDALIADPSRPSGMSSRYRCKDGSELPFESTRRVLRSGAGWLVGAISRDIRERISAEKQLRESEARFRSLTALSSDWYWEQDAELRTTYVSREFSDKTGVEGAARLGRRRWEMDFTPLSCTWEEHRAQLEARKPFHDFEYMRAGQDGQNRYFSLSGEPVFDSEGRFTGYRGIGRNITQRKRSEREIVQLGRMYAALGAANEAILRAKSPQEVFEGACEIAVNAGGFLLGTVFVLDPATKTLSRAAASGAAASLVENIVPSMDESQPGGKGLIGHACRTGLSAISNDYRSDPRTEARRDLVPTDKVGSAAVFPLRVEDELVGVFGLQHAERNAFSEELTDLLQRLADDISFALENFRREARRLEAEQALREGEERFRSLTGLSSDMYWEQDEQHRFTKFSGTAPERIKSGRAQMIGKRRWDQHFFSMSEADWVAHRAVLEARKPFRDLEMGRVNEAGETVWVRVSGEPVFDASGAFTGYRGVGKDITARKREEDLLRLEHAVPRCLAEADSAAAGLKAVMQAICESQGWMSGRYFVADEEAGVLRFGQAWGVSSPEVEQFIAKSRTLVYARGQGLSGAVWQSGEPLWVSEARKDSRASGSSRAAGGTTAGLQGGAFVFPVISEGRTIGVLSFSRGDAREPDARLLQAVRVIGSQVGQFLQRKQVQSALLDSEARLRQTFDLAGSGIAHVTLDGRFLRVNPKLCQILGYSERELIGRSVKEISYRDDRDVTDAQRARVHAGELPAVSFEKRYVRKDGSVIWVSLSVAVAHAADGAPEYEISLLEDITQRKRAEERQASHLRHQERIARFGQSALAKREPAELIDEAVQTLLEALAADGVAYVERGPGEGELVLRAVVGVADTKADSGPIACQPDNPILQVLGSGNRLVIDGAGLRLPWASRLRSAALLPVRGEQGVRGALCVFYQRADGFAADELSFVEATASVLSTGLQRIESEGRLAYLAQFDALTGLPNRALLADRFSQMIVQARRHGSGLGVLFIDLDEFKMVNDTLGHAGGDELLKEVAVRLQSAVRQGDTVARISGDEFAVVLADLARPEDAALVAQKIIDRLAATVEIRGQELFVTASVGIAVFPGDGGDAETLIGAADAAMYRAKQSGRNAYQFFTADINQRARARVQMGTELRRALEREEFALVYQPKYDLAERRPNGAEALLRWNHPERGVVSPVEFIPVLEETGLIVQVGEWVLRRACEDLKAWQAAGLEVGSVAVNLSARQFRQQDLDQRIKSIVAAAGVEPGLIELEITESQVMQDPDHAIQVLRSLSEAGMRIAIDDFGTGYSSLAYLTRFPVAALKIDRSFVKNMFSDKGDAAIVRTIIEMAHTLEFTVIAEGVETEEQANFLRLLRCEQAQGYLFARPMPAQDLAALFASCERQVLSR